MLISVITRRLREGKTYEDFRAAWLPNIGFGVPTRVVSAQNMDDRQEIVTIGFSDMSEEQAAAFLEQVGNATANEEKGERPSDAEGLSEDVVAENQARHDRIGEVVEPEMTRAYYVQVGDDDLS